MTRLSLRVIVVLAWVLLVLYPNPYLLVKSAQRLKEPPILPSGVTEIVPELSDLDFAEIELYVYRRLPYRYDWEVYSMPWYFPTLEEILEKGAGDCKARFLLFASLLEEMGLPYETAVSLTHIWVNYEGKTETALESEAEMLFVVDEEGRSRFSLPRPDLERSWQSFYRAFWKTMPPVRKFLLLAGSPLAFILPGLIHFGSLEKGTRSRKLEHPI